MPKIQQFTEELLKRQVLYGPETQTLLQSAQRTIYKMENATGVGILTRYPVFTGIELLYNDIHMSDSVNQNKLPTPGLMEINHCRVGRFECEFPNGQTAYLGEGDLAVNMLTNATSGAWFPLAHYHGISIVVDLPAASRVLAQVAEAMGGMSFDLYSLQERLCADNTCFIMRSTESIKHIFSELYTAPSGLRSSYIKLKVLELFLFLNSEELFLQQEKRPYFNKEQVHTVKAIKAYLTEHLDRQITLGELSEKFDMPLTSMKLCFKGIYGSTISAYMHDYRMQYAAALLRQTTQSITEIAGQVGYANVSKFSAAFKLDKGATPLEYRRSFVQMEQNLSLGSGKD